jgi:Fe-S cluster biogenesis protein NfuA
MTEEKVQNREERIRTLIEGLSSYIETYHGGWVETVAIKEDLVEVRLGGACDGCALSPTTLKGWVGGTIQQFFPEIKDVVAVE